MGRGPLDYAPPPPARRTPAWVAVVLSLGATALLLEGLCASGGLGSRARVVRAQRAAAAADLANLSVAIESFRQDCGRYPTAVEGVSALSVQPPQLPGWHGPYLKRPAVDPWGKGYVYIPPAGSNPQQLLSAGPDGRAGTADDVTATPPQATP